MKYIILSLNLISIHQVMASPVSPMLGANWKASMTYRNPEFHEIIISYGMAKSIKSDLENRYRSYEYKKNYGLTDSSDDCDFVKNQSRWSSQVVVQIQNYHIQNAGRTLAQVHAGDPIIKSLKKPVLYASIGAALYFGYPLQFAASDNSKISLRSELSNKKAQIEYLAPDWEASLGVAGSLTESEHLRLPDRPQSLPSGEAARVGASKTLGFLDIRMGMGYGVTTTTATQSLSKPLTKNINLALERHQTLKSSNAVDKSDETIKLNYGINF